MLSVAWKFIRSIFGFFLRMLYPLKRLVCRRRKLSTSEPVELTSIGTGDGLQIPSHSYGGFINNEEEPQIEMESWDSWVDHPDSPPQPEHYSYHAESQMNSNGHVLNNQDDKKLAAVPASHHTYHNKKKTEPEPEPELNFFEDMTPAVMKQKKFLVRKKEQSGAADQSTGFSSRLAMVPTIPVQTSSELENWDDNENAWGNEDTTEDLTWQAEEAIREKKRKERMERQMEQQRRKQKKEEMRGIKGSSLVATKIS